MKQIKQCIIKTLYSTITILSITTWGEKPLLNSNLNTLEQLEQAHIWQKNTSLKLHLGCGMNHLKGYVNLDFPSSEHTVQTIQAADAFVDITKLTFPPQSVDEIRSHHVFEHFDRQAALALLCKWYDWLKIGGTLVIETPDFEGSIKLFLDSRYSYSQKQSILRHIFGSHEAHWAMHYDGWYKDKFEHVLSTLGFTHISFEFTQWQLTKNIIVRAQKTTNISHAQVQKKAKKILRESMVDQTEEKMWQTWCSLFDGLMQAK